MSFAVDVSHQEGVAAGLGGCVGDGAVLSLSGRDDDAGEFDEVVVAFLSLAEPDVAVVGIGAVVGDVECDVDSCVGLHGIVAQCDAVDGQAEDVGGDVGQRAAVGWLLNADDGILPVVEAVGRRAASDALLVGVEGREHEVVVAHAAPSPVDVEEVGAALVFIAVAYELVSASVAHAAIQDWASLFQFVVDEVCPVGIAVGTSGNIFRSAGIVVEIVNEGCCNVFGVGAGGWAVVHLDGVAAILHQRGDGIALCCGVAAAVAVLHVSPVEGDDGQGGEGDAVAGGGVSGDGFLGLCRPLVVVHHLCHGRCHAACGALAARIIGGAEVVERCVLVPCACKHRSDGVGAVRADFASSLPEHAYLAVLLLQPGYLVGIALQPCPHVVGDVVDVDVVGVAESQDGAGAVVARYDDEAALVFYVEHIEPAHLALQCELLLHSLSLTGLAGNGLLIVQEVLGKLDGLLCSHFFCRCSAYTKEGQEQCHEFSH